MAHQEEALCGCIVLDKLFDMAPYEANLDEQKWISLTIVPCIALIYCDRLKQ